MSVNEGTRFAFGANWSKLDITADRINAAVESLRRLFPKGLEGNRFLDVGCGSGLFSLAAVKLGAVVHSFDYDALCVECARKLKLDHAPRADWRIERGSILDTTYLQQLGIFDVVYSWGVLHHTGDLRSACRNAASMAGSNGHLVIAIYNDQGWRSRYWMMIKRAYCTKSWLRPLIVALHVPLLIARVLARIVRGQLRLPRGMSLWRDFLDWLGGYPFEVASRDAVIALHEDFKLIRFVPARSGCNEYTFARRST